MTATQRPQLPGRVVRAQTLGPGAGRHRQRPATQLQQLAILSVLNLHTAHPAIFAQQLPDSHTIERQRAIRPRFSQHTHHQACIIG
ncbi:hypothetical protein D3C76_1290250 [compost metagenome]